MVPNRGLSARRTPRGTEQIHRKTKSSESLRNLGGRQPVVGAEDQLSENEDHGLPCGQLETPANAFGTRSLGERLCSLNGRKGAGH